MSEDNTSEYYTLLPAKVRYCQKISWGAKVLYSEIEFLARQKGYCFSLNKYFVENLNATSRTITRWLEELINTGYIKREVTRDINNQVIGRKLYIVDLPSDNFVTTPDKNVMRYGQNSHNPPDKNGILPPDKNVRDNNTSINNTSINNIDQSTLSDDFDKLWKLYPNKKGKPKAFASYKKAIKDGVTNKAIQDGIVAYSNYIDVNRTDKQFIKHGSTFFNNRAWEDDYTTSDSENDYSDGPQIYEHHISDDDIEAYEKLMKEGF